PQAPRSCIYWQWEGAGRSALLVFLARSPRERRRPKKIGSGWQPSAIELEWGTPLAKLFLAIPQLAGGRDPIDGERYGPHVRIYAYTRQSSAGPRGVGVGLVRLAGSGRA